MHITRTDISTFYCTGCDKTETPGMVSLPVWSYKSTGSHSTGVGFETHEV